MRRALILAFIGSLLGTLLDYSHVASGTIVYSHPAIRGVAWWVPLLYASAGLGIGLSHPWLDARFRADGASTRRETSPENVLFALVGLAAVWGSSGYLPMADSLRSLVLGPLALGVWFACDRTRYGLVLALATALVGCLVELGLSSLGAFRYVHPDAGPIASWLPWIYVTASVAVGNLGRFLGDNAPLPALTAPERSIQRAGGDS